MKQWIVGGLAVAGVGVGLYFLTAKHESPEPIAVPEVQPVVPPACPPPPAVLAQVIDVTDLDPLLDPPDRPQIGLPFEEPTPAPVNATPEPPFIPPAVENEPTER